MGSSKSQEHSITPRLHAKLDIMRGRKGLFSLEKILTPLVEQSSKLRTSISALKQIWLAFTLLWLLLSQRTFAPEVELFLSTLPSGTGTFDSLCGLQHHASITFNSSSWLPKLFSAYMWKACKSCFKMGWTVPWVLRWQLADVSNLQNNHCIFQGYPSVPPFADKDIVSHFWQPCHDSINRAACVTPFFLVLEQSNIKTDILN